MNYSDVEVSDNDSTSPQPQQEQQSTDQSPPSSAQATPLGSKGHNTQKCGVQPNKKQQKTSNEPKKNAKGKRRGPNSSQQQAVNPSHSSSSSSPSSTTPKNQKKKKGSKGSSPPRLDPFSQAQTHPISRCLTQSLVCSLLGMTSGSYQRMSLKQQLPQSKDPQHQVLTAVQDVVCGSK